jgi:hypothetical protein
MFAVSKHANGEQLRRPQAAIWDSCSVIEMVSLLFPFFNLQTQIAGLHIQELITQSIVTVDGYNCLHLFRVFDKFVQLSQQPFDGISCRLHCHVNVQQCVFGN